MATGRQVQLWWGSNTLNLNDATYILQADGGWEDQGSSLAITVLVKATTLTELERRVAELERRLTAAVAYTMEFTGEPLYVVTKVCDEIQTIAEIGPTWKRKQVLGGSVIVTPVTGTAAVPSARVTLGLMVEEAWQRAKPQFFMEVPAAATAFSVGSDGSIYANNVAFTARRIEYTTGVTARYHWKMDTSMNCTFLMGTNMKAYFDAADDKLKMQDNSVPQKTAATAALTSLNNTIVDVVFEWINGNGLRIYVNGAIAAINSTGCAIETPTTYTVWHPTGGYQYLYNVQIWPDPLYITQITPMYNAGRPDPEMPFMKPPSDDKLTNGRYQLYNVPGDRLCPARVFLASASATMYMARMAIRPYAVRTVHVFECESGTLGTGVAVNTQANASAGYQARFTPTDTGWLTRVTLEIANRVDDVAPWVGRFRLLLACYDSALATGINLVRWYLTVAGQNEGLSDELSVAAVSKRSLLDLGTIDIPPGAWPETAKNATTNIYTTTSYIQVKLDVKNTVGVGGGTFDLDALYLMPLEEEGVLKVANGWGASLYPVFDFVSNPAAFVAVYDYKSLEFGKWAEWTGDALGLPPVFGTAGELAVVCYRDQVEEYYPNDTVDVYLAAAPRYVR